MTQLQADSNAQKSRWALEALRNGVPNSAAVELLGCNQPAAEERFRDLIGRAADRSDPPPGAQGMLVSGEFGSGKSHLLTHLERLALDGGFVCSRVAVSKETPLFDLRKAYVSAVDHGRMPDRSGRLIEELALGLRPHSGDYASFFEWANDDEELNSIFPASLLVHERSNDPELMNEIQEFWAGGRISLSRIRYGLRQIGQLSSFVLSAPRAAELPAQQLRFAVRLIQAAGYRGWVVLLDEIELIASYSLLQRARSYAELASWLGRSGNLRSVPGLLTVATITDDFASAVITDGKMDRDTVGARLQVRHAHLEALAETGMRAIIQEPIPLKTPSEEDAQAAIERLRAIYTDSYSWQAPRLEAAGPQPSIRRSMRYKVRSAINEWDLRRLHPDYEPETESHEFRHSYEENPDLERESPDETALVEDEA